MTTAMLTMRAPGFFAATLPVVGQNGFLPAKANLFLKNDVF